MVRVQNGLVIVLGRIVRVLAINELYGSPLGNRWYLNSCNPLLVAIRVLVVGRDVRMDERFFSVASLL